MQDQETIKKLRRIVIIGTIIFVSVIVVISVIIMHFQGLQGKVIVNNLSTCAPNISDSTKTAFFKNLYKVVTAQDQATSKSPQSYYYAHFRDNSCTTEELAKDKAKSYHTSAIIDIKSRGYSFKISFAWTKTKDAPKFFDSGNVGLYCLKDEELIYPKFDCSKNSFITQEQDVIYNWMPYVGQNFYMVASKSSKSKSGVSLNVIYQLNREYYRENKINILKAEVEVEIDQFFKAHDLQREDYDFTYELRMAEN